MELGATIRAMRAAGCTDGQILDALEAMDEAKVQREIEAAEERRAKERERQRRYRENRRNGEAVTPVAVVTRDKRDSAEANIEHAPVRVEGNPSRVTPTGKKIDSPHSPPRGAKRGTRIPDDWQPDIAAAQREGLSEPEAWREAERFRDYYLGAPNAKGVKLDWPATWRNWCKNAVDRRRGRGADPPKRGSAALVEALDQGFPQ